MKMKLLFIGVMSNLIFGATMANADVVFQTNRVAGQDACEGLNGAWAGGGTMTAKVLGVNVKCDYYGNANVTEPSMRNYSVDVVFDLQSGSAVCPGRQAYTLPGTCDSETGAIILKTDDVNLWGNLENNATQAKLQGTVKVSIKGRSITGNVNNLVLNKQ